MKNLMLVLKGFVIGIANIIPGVSGGTLALTLGVYEDLISTISHFFKNIKKNILFILPLGIGMVLSILSMSNIISYAFDKIPLITAMFFMGLVLGGIPMLYGHVKGKKEAKKVSSYIIAIITFSLVIMLAFAKELFGTGLGNVTLNTNIGGLFMMLIIGVIAAATMIIPGVSGSLVLLLLGYYDPVVNAIKELTHFNNIGLNFINLAFFGIGVLIGIVLIAKLLEILFKKHETKTYFGVLGFIIASIPAIPVSVYHEYGQFNFSVISVIVGILLLIVGAYLGKKLGDK